MIPSRLIVLSCALLLSACGYRPTSPVLGTTLTILGSAPHDRSAYTQGFLFHDGVFFESTGLYGASSVRKVEPTTGAIIDLVELPDQYFGEGLAALRDRLYLVTWKEGTGFVFTSDPLESVATFRYAGEGWGLTSDGSYLILSDGTYRLKFLDPATAEVVRVVEVNDDGRFIFALNELEWVEGEIWANIWQQDNIARIDPATGEVLGWVNVAGFVSWWDRRRGAEVANGIAYDSVAGRLWVTGKNWPRVFEVDFRAVQTGRTTAFGGWTDSRRRGREPLVAGHTSEAILTDFHYVAR